MVGSIACYSLQLVAENGLYKGGLIEVLFPLFVKVYRNDGVVCHVGGIEHQCAKTSAENERIVISINDLIQAFDSASTVEIKIDSLINPYATRKFFSFAIKTYLVKGTNKYLIDYSVDDQVPLEILQPLEFYSVRFSQTNY